MRPTGGVASSSPTVPPTPSEALGLDEGWGPDRAELDRAARIVGRMRLPDLAGQVIVAEWRGTTAPVQLVRDLHLGGVIAFDSNVVSAAQIAAVNTALTRRVGRRWPLFLGVDQEGGVVERMRSVATRFPTFMSTGAADDPSLTQRAYAASGAELRGLGFTVDFAPDADVTSGPGDPTIGSRSASSRPASGGRAGRGRGRRVRRVRRAAGHQALPRPRLGARGQPPDAAGADQVARGARRVRPGAVPQRGRGGAARGDGRSSRRPGHRPARPLVALPQGRDRPAARRPRFRGPRRDRLARHGRRHPWPRPGTYGRPGDPGRLRRPADAALAGRRPRRRWSAR